MAKNNSMPIQATSSAPEAEEDAVYDLRDDAYENMGTWRCTRPHVARYRSKFLGFLQDVNRIDCHVMNKKALIGTHFKATPRMRNTAHCLDALIRSWGSLLCQVTNKRGPPEVDRALDGPVKRSLRSMMSTMFYSERFVRHCAEATLTCHCTNSMSSNCAPWIS